MLDNTIIIQYQRHAMSVVGCNGCGGLQILSSYNTIQYHRHAMHIEGCRCWTIVIIQSSIKGIQCV